MTISYANEGEYAQKYAGRLEKAHIFDINENGTPIGNINGSSIPVVDAGKYMNHVVLARLKTRLGLRSTLSSFITSHIPKDFESLSPKDYMLLGLWDNDMEKRGRIPTFEEFYNYYSPGKTFNFLYLEDDSTCSKGRFQLVSNGTLLYKKGSIPKMIRAFNELNFLWPRVILTNSSRELTKVMDAVEQSGQVPILMERLK